VKRIEELRGIGGEKRQGREEEQGMHGGGAPTFLREKKKSRTSKPSASASAIAANSR